MDDWYKIAVEEERLKLLSSLDNEAQLIKEASWSGFLKTIPVWIIAAVLALSHGNNKEAVKEQILEKYQLNTNQYAILDQTISNSSSIENILEAIRQDKERKQIEENKLPQQLQQPNQNQQNQQVKNQQPAINNISMNEFVTHVLQHEGLADPRQTPVRITFKHMREWDTLYGYPVYKGPKKPGTDNFFYMQNPADVRKVVNKVFMNYAENPQKWGLHKNPTIKSAIHKFDQSNATAKLDYFKKHIKGFDENAPLRSLL